jgi:hypothetical protein
MRRLAPLLVAVLLAAGIAALLIFGPRRPTAAESTAQPTAAAVPELAVAAMPESPAPTLPTARVEVQTLGPLASSTTTSSEPRSPARLVLRVVDDQGTPVAGATFRLTAKGTRDWVAADPLRNTTTVTEAEPSSIAVPVGVELTGWLEAPEGTYYRSLSHTFPAFAPGEVRQQTLTLVRPRGIFHGLVLAEEDERPLAGVAIFVDRPSNNVIFGGQYRPRTGREEPVVTTDAEGRFQLPRERHGDAQAFAEATGRTLAMLRIDESGASELDPHRIRLTRSAQLLGKIEHTSELFPVRVEVTCPGYHLGSIGGTQSVYLPHYQWSAAVDADGQFTLDELPSRVPLEIVVSGAGRTQIPQESPLRLEPGATLQVQWQLSAGAELTVQALDEGGNAVAGLDLELFAADAVSGTRGRQAHGSSSRRGTTDGTGWIRWPEVTPGTWYVGLPRWFQRSAADAPDFVCVLQPVTLPPGGEAAHLELRVETAVTIEGIVVDPGGVPLAQVDLWAFDSLSGLSANGESAADGTFRLAPLGRGAYRLTASRQPDAAPELARTQIDAVDAPIRDLEIVMPWGGALNVRLVDPSDGSELPGRVIVEEARDGGRLQLQNSHGPPLRIGQLAPGIYRVSARASDGRVGWRDAVEVLAGEQSSVDLELQPSSEVRIHYRGPQEYCTVSIERDGVTLELDSIASGTSTILRAPLGRSEVRFKRYVPPAMGTEYQRIEHRVPIQATAGVLAEAEWLVDQTE